jgi:hypothetical protein
MASELLPVLGTGNVSCQSVSGKQNEVSWLHTAMSGLIPTRISSFVMLT